MATFQMRESGYVQARVRRRGYPVQSKTFPNKTLAQEWARRVEAEIDRGTYVSASTAERTTIGDLIKDFKSDFAPLHYRVREDEREAWRFQLDRLTDFFGDYSIAAVDQKLVASFRDSRLKGSTDRRKVGKVQFEKNFICCPNYLATPRMKKA
ncbi:MAG: hypothetical protein IPJ73_02130 [Zoogloea sp.]|nr:hypothetical protein [Zoogloea sp.]